MTGRFEGQVALVTGAAGGIGEGVARCLANEGAKVALLDLDMGSLANLQNELNQTNGHAQSYQVNITNEDEIREAIAKIEQDLGLVQLAVTCAGIIRIAPFTELSLSDWQRTLDVNLTGTFLTFKHVARRLVEQNQTGSLVGIASVAGRSGRPTAADYAASKAGVISLVRSAALALAPHGINVNAVCPGVVDTPMTRQIHIERAAQLGKTAQASLADMLSTIPLGRIQSTSDVADAVTFLLSPQGRYITGQALNSCGGIEMD